MPRHRRGFSSDYLSSTLDIFTLLNALHKQAHTGIRDYLVHRLYDMSDADIDFTLPQLCSLLLSWDVNRSYRLSEFLIAKCSQSIHLSLKVLWILQAHEYYSRKEEERSRVRELIHTCEMSLVNASIFGEGEHAADGQGGNLNSSTAQRLKAQKARLHIRNSNYYAEQQEKRRLASPTHQADTALSPTSPDRPFIFGPATNAYTARIYSPVHASSSTDQIEATTFSFKETSVPSPPSNQPHQSIPVSVEEVYLALSKKVKCFAEHSTRVLTHRGLLFLDEIEERLTAGERLRYACYDVKSRAIEYRPGRLVYPEAPASMLEFNSPGEGQRWVEDIDFHGEEEGVDREAVEDGSGVSLCVTGDHDMFVQRGHISTLEPPIVHWSSPAPAKVPASALLSHCDCAAALAGEDDCEHRRATIRLLGCAEAGHSRSASGSAPVAARAQDRLGLTSSQFLAFVGLLGFWLGDGSLSYRTRCRGQLRGRESVVFAQRKSSDRVWLAEQLAAAGLLRRSAYEGDESRRCYITVTASNGVEQFHVVDRRWLHFFDEEFGALFPCSQFYHGSTPTVALTVKADHGDVSTMPRRIASGRRGSSDLPRASEEDEEQVPMKSEAPRTGHDEEEDLEDAGESINSVNWFPEWLLMGLAPPHLREVIEGLRRAIGSSSRKRSLICTHESRFRDQLVHALLNCGYSPRVTAAYSEGSTRCALCEEEHTQDPTKKATAHCWRVSWAVPNTPEGEGSCRPSLLRREGITERAYHRQRDGRIWCVNVEHSDHLIFVQRAQRDSCGVVIQQSRPLIVGQCEYFNLELQLIHQLILISTHLVRFPPSYRKAKLRSMLKSLPASHLANLYFPSNIPNAEHYRILQLLPNECISLNSRDKAPYLMYCEIEYTGKSTYDYDIYVAYKDHEAILEESISLCEEGQVRTDDEVAEVKGKGTGITTADGTPVKESPKSGGSSRKSSNGRLEAATTSESSETGSLEKGNRPPPLNTSNLSSSTPIKSHPSQKSSGSSRSSRRPSLDRPLVPGVDAAEQIRQQTEEAQEAVVQRVFHDLDSLHEEKNSIGAKVKSAFSSDDAHPASDLGEVATLQKKEEEESRQHQPRVIRIKPLPTPEPILSPTKRNDPPLFRVSSASQPDSPVEATQYGTSAPRAGHADALTHLIDNAEGDEKRRFEEETGGFDMASLAAATADIEKSSGVKVIITPDSSSSASPALLSPVSEEGRGRPAAASLVRSRRMSHAVSSPNLQADTPEQGGSAPTSRAPSPGSHHGHVASSRPSKHSKSEHGTPSHSQGSGRHHHVSLQSSAPRPTHPPTPAHPEPAYMSNPQWQKLDAAFGDRWAARKRRVFAASPYKHLPRWDLLSCIFKSGDDCRQEQLAMQLIRVFDHIWKEAKLPLWLCPYSVLITSPTSGLIETIQDATSIDALKKAHLALDPAASLAGFFHLYFGLQGQDRHVEATRNFAESMAGYSVICYLLQIKDRHNGNIMMDREGHLIHIDYGFMLSNSPGRNWGWESSPFKLTSEYINVLTIDTHHSFFPYFRTLVVQGYMEARKHWHVVSLLIEMMMQGQGSSLPCFAGAGEAGTLLQLRQRFLVDASDEEALQHAMGLIDKSIDNWRTVQYDQFQRMTNGII